MWVRSHLYWSDTLLLSRSCADTTSVRAPTAAKTDFRCVQRDMPAPLRICEQHSRRHAGATRRTRRSGTNSGTNFGRRALPEAVEQPAVATLFDEVDYFIAALQQRLDFERLKIAADRGLDGGLVELLESGEDLTFTAGNVARGLELGVGAERARVIDRP